MLILLIGVIIILSIIYYLEKDRNDIQERQAKIERDLISLKETIAEEKRKMDEIIKQRIDNVEV